MIDELVFTGLLWLSQASPGPDQSLVVRTSLAYGLRSGLIVSWGIATGIILHAILAVTVGGLLLTGPWHVVLCALGGAWMLYLAYKTCPRRWRAEELAAEEEVIQPQEIHLFRDALICNLLNPKCTIFMVSLMIPLMSKPHTIWYSAALVVFTVVNAGLGWSCWAWLFQHDAIRNWYRHYSRWVDAVFALALVAFGLMLVGEVIA